MLWRLQKVPNPSHQPTRHTTASTRLLREACGNAAGVFLQSQPALYCFWSCLKGSHCIPAVAAANAAAEAEAAAYAADMAAADSSSADTYLADTYSADSSSADTYSADTPSGDTCSTPSGDTCSGDTSSAETSGQSVDDVGLDAHLEQTAALYQTPPEDSVAPADDNSQQDLQLFREEFVCKAWQISGCTPIH